MPLIRAASTVSTQGSHTATLSTSLRSSTVSPPRVSTVTAHATTTATGVQSATAVSGALQIQSSDFPVRIVVGSVAGGMALAIVVVLVWTYLGKSFRRQRQDQAVRIDIDDVPAIKILTNPTIISALYGQAKTINMVPTLNVSTPARGFAPLRRRNLLHHPTMRMRRLAHTMEYAKFPLQIL
jgi:hypothetical protein